MLLIQKYAYVAPPPPLKNPERPEGNVIVYCMTKLNIYLRKQFKTVKIFKRHSY